MQAQNYTYQQDNNKAFSIGLDMPVAIRNEFFTVGAGASIKGEYPIGENLSVTAAGGYQILRVKDAYRTEEGPNKAGAFIPVKAGVKYFLGDGLYFEGEGGISIETNYAKRKYAVIALGPGLMVPMKNRSSIDFSLRYEDWGSSRIKVLGIRAAYRFDWL
ncbi:hypothetical protein DYU05_15730 [Mucilaginibacter terrenus]|uniref:Outer membrane protein beta-barrel domain-containing protein n=1 Tax=Mucilaginibacter terrenus TaxID=2482727 RepID=A0A3E2NM64_9SPHI|nr:hypothetical protein DYU05_15730 [Mucilaginibacter terrenus]